MNLHNNIERIFTFGCSFTKYFWATWPEILAYELDCNLYNYGRSGAGNQFIANMVVQANNYHNFSKNDLVIVSWTNVCREDRWLDKSWITPGNIFTQNEFDIEFVKKWADPLGYIIRDLATIDLAKNLLHNTGANWDMFSMCNLVEKIDQAGGSYIESKHPETLVRVKDLYKNTLEIIKPSFMEVLWKNSVYEHKLRDQEKLFDKKFSDGHPDPEEHLKYLQHVLNIDFSQETHQKVYQSNNNLNNFLLEECKNRKKRFALYELDNTKLINLKNLSLITKSIDPNFI